MGLEQKRILITGGGGFLGRHLIERFRAAGCDCIAAPRRSQYDLTSAAAVEALFSEVRPQVVVHAAAVVGGIGANRASPGRFFYENAIMGIQVIQAARRHGVEKLVVLGSICAYPKFTPVPFREAVCQAYRQQYGLNAVFLLPVNQYGPGDHFDPDRSHVIPALIRKCIEAPDGGQREVVLLGDGSPTREFLYVKDAAEGVLAATLRYDKPEPVAGQPFVTVRAGS